MSKYTPSPWKVYAELNVRDNNNNYVCSCGGNRPNQAQYIEECKANARLIAAAPELLEACKDLLDDYFNGHILQASINEAKQAIAKAEGLK